MKNKIFEICNTLAEQGIKPTLERVRSELGGGSFSTINPALKEWKESRAVADDVTPTGELPSEVAAIGQKSATLIWKVAQELCNEMVKSVRHEADLAIEKSYAERDEALNEIRRLEAENELLGAKNVQQDAIIQELRVQAALSAKSESMLDMLRAELEQAKKQNAVMEGMLKVYEAIGGSSDDTVKKTQSRKAKTTASDGNNSDK